MVNLSVIALWINLCTLTNIHTESFWVLLRLGLSGPILISRSHSAQCRSNRDIDTRQYTWCGHRKAPWEDTSWRSRMPHGKTARLCIPDRRLWPPWAAIPWKLSGEKTFGMSLWYASFPSQGIPNWSQPLYRKGYACRSRSWSRELLTFIQRKQHSRLSAR